MPGDGGGRRYGRGPFRSLVAIGSGAGQHAQSSIRGWTARRITGVVSLFAAGISPLARLVSLAQGSVVALSGAIDRGRCLSLVRFRPRLFLATNGAALDRLFFGPERCATGFGQRVYAGP